MNPPGNRPPKPDWKGLTAQAGDVLGPEFWQDIASIIPLTGPRIDMYETPQELVVVAEVPGLSAPEQIQLSFRDQSLLIRGHLVRPYQVLDEQMRLSERFFGAFERTIRLPGRALTEQMRAQYHNGLLIIRIPLAPPDGEKVIPIQFT
ncbi:MULTISPECIES: Hsp20/alpha crystallin family protein [Paenibacillus]|jgi:HSP20 family protein|uniref:Hsp20 family protein n=2 Tax=Paenibacillus TaxID=44249 RepID=A0A6L8V220_9BACL|nr:MULTISPECIES: Hsp20/alpha crystallin family protein [Paenibacillus]MBA2943402.1 Hsp20/alpha crystallin family protein [Paenibacillus sp. CGMCC 1.16610]MVQ33901.1 Hsp20 family protein [Paenibacillus anseongense]MZQ83591.1 Hsp20 family protein [Paenibacillus silvestris]